MPEDSFEHCQLRAEIFNTGGFFQNVVEHGGGNDVAGNILHAIAQYAHYGEWMRDVGLSATAHFPSVRMARDADSGMKWKRHTSHDRACSLPKKVPGEEWRADKWSQPFLQPKRTFHTAVERLAVEE